MGIARGFARLLLDECSRRPFHGSVVQLGKHDIYFGMSKLGEWASSHGVELAKKQSPMMASRGDLAKRRCIDDRTFFCALGFECVESLDISDFEGASLAWDMNRPIPDTYHSRYDVILDGGTLEHIFHTPKVLQNIHMMTKEGGRVIHGAPSSNFVDHGFYMFSPTFFYDYYTANNWEINAIKLFKVPRMHDVGRWKIYDYSPGCLDGLSLGAFSKGYGLGTYVVATKTKRSTCDVVPQQGAYGELWDNSGSRDSAPQAPPKLLRQLASVLVRYPRLFHLATWSYAKATGAGRLPPLAAKY